MDLTLKRLQGLLGSRPFRYYDQCPSTNDLALELLATRSLLESLAEAEFICTDEQTKGKGRLGRSWYAPPGTALMLSMLFPLTDSRDLPRMTMLGALSIAEVAEALGMAGVGIKWPNDVQVQGRKVSGVLSEANWQPGGESPRLHGVVLGMGINVRIDFNGTPFESTAVSLEPALGRPVDRAELLLALLARLDHWYARRASDDLFEVWRGRLTMLGKRVEINQGGVILSGMAEDVDPQGALFLRGLDGKRQRVIAGDVALGGA
jgi:BirA family biotin operon repressor/biotin-[acetyl-CoA-carboxylase] ligase